MCSNPFFLESLTSTLQIFEFKVRKRTASTGAMTLDTLVSMSLEAIDAENAKRLLQIVAVRAELPPGVPTPLRSQVSAQRVDVVSVS